MRRLALLAAVALGSAAAPADAAVVQYGLDFERSYVFFDPRNGDPTPFVGRPGGSFTFDTTANQLVRFDVFVGYPAGPASVLNDQAIALFNAAGPCDLTCLIGALNGQTWQTIGGNGQLGTTINIAPPLNGSVGVRLSSGPILSLAVGGTYRVTGPIPEPGTWALLLLGFAMIGGVLRGQRFRALKAA